VKRQEDWIPITARVSVDSARRLRVTAARKGIPAGQVLDELIQAGLEPDGPPPRRAKATPIATTNLVSWTSKRLAHALAELDLSQAAFARHLGVAQKTVNNWILSGRIPIVRHADIDRLVDKVRKRKPR
jgi:hypothetical protein